jgi:hypothetical protein
MKEKNKTKKRMKEEKVEGKGVSGEGVEEWKEAFKCEDKVRYEDRIR